MAEMKGIKVCVECANYDWKKHKCRIGCHDDSNAQAPFYGDCPLPDVVPKSEVERWRRNLEAVLEEIPETKREVASEIFAEIEKLHLHITNEFDLRRYNELKKKYTEGGK